MPYSLKDDPDLSKGRAMMENLLALLSPPPTCAQCGAELPGSGAHRGPIMDRATGEDFCDAVCRADYREHYS